MCGPGWAGRLGCCSKQCRPHCCDSQTQVLGVPQRQSQRWLPWRRLQLPAHKKMLKTNRRARGRCSARAGSVLMRAGSTRLRPSTKTEPTMSSTAITRVRPATCGTCSGRQRRGCTRQAGRGGASNCYQCRQDQEAGSGALAAHSSSFGQPPHTHPPGPAAGGALQGRRWLRRCPPRPCCSGRRTSRTARKKRGVHDTVGCRLAPPGGGDGGRGGASRRRNFKSAGRPGDASSPVDHC